jgi:hypothetical protein
MEIKHVDGTSTNTDKLPDVDAELVEECQKLHALFKKYNRQLFLVGDVNKSEVTKQRGMVFFHIMPAIAEGEQLDREAYRQASSIYWGRVDMNIRGMTNYSLGIGVIPPPQVQPYPEPPKE